MLIIWARVRFDENGKPSLLAKKNNKNKKDLKYF